MYAGARKQKELPPQKPHVKKGDTVLVLSGKDRGKQAKVLRVNPSKGTAIVERVNLLKKHTRANPQSPIRLSNLQVVCPSCNEPTRTGSHRTAEGARRFCRKCETEM